MPHVELPQAEFKVVLLGDSNSGKTSLVLRFAEGYYRDTPRDSTVGAFFITKRIQTSSGITCKIQIWDTAGQPQFRPMAPMYYKNAAAAIICYDATSSHSYKIMREWLDELHRNVPAGSIVLAIASTKCDLLNTLRPAVKLDEAEALAEALGAIFVDTSAKDNYGVTTVFQRVAERVLRFRENGNTNLPISPSNLPNTSGTANTSNSNNHHGHESYSTPEASSSGKKLFPPSRHNHQYGMSSARRVDHHNAQPQTPQHQEQVPHQTGRQEDQLGSENNRKYKDELNHEINNNEKEGDNLTPSRQSNKGERDLDTNNHELFNNSFDAQTIDPGKDYCGSPPSCGLFSDVIRLDPRSQKESCMIS